MNAEHPLVQQDPYLEQVVDNVVTVRWVPGEHRVPNGSIGVALSNAEPYIVQQETEPGLWIITQFTPNTDGNVPNNMFFLVANAGDVAWVDYDHVAGQLPENRIQCRKAGRHGNMFVGRRNGEVGMVVYYQRNWTYYTGNIVEGFTQDFQILCRA